MTGVAGQSALVTGGARGIGRAVVEALLAGGARVMLADLDFTEAERTARALDVTGERVFPFPVDVAEPDQCEAMVAAAAERFGGLQILVHSAGVGLERPFLETTDTEWQRLIGIDLTGAFYVLRAAGREMALRNYGRIVTIASTAGIAGGTGRAAYGAAKGGVVMLTRVLAVELAMSGVTVNALAPGAIETELVARMHSARTRTNYTRAIPADRYGTPGEVAAAALFLASREASYVTGHVLAVDGGFLAAGVLNKP